MRYKHGPAIVGLVSLLGSYSVPGVGAETVRVDSLPALRRAIASAPPTGRIIRLAPGVYRQVRPIEVQGKNHLTIRGAGPGYANTVVSGPGIDDMRVKNNFRIDASDDVTIRDLTIENSAYHAIQVAHGSDFFVARNLKTWDNGESGFKVDSPARKDAHGTDVYSDYGTIEHCVIGFTDSGRRGVVEGIDIVGAVGWTVRGNWLNNIRKANGHAAYAVFAKGNSHATVIENNVVTNSSVGLSFGGGGTGRRFFRHGQTAYETRGGVIRHNVIYHLGDSGIYLNKARDFDVYGNTVIDTGPGVGSIVARYPASRGRIHDNIVSMPITVRDGGHARVRGNTLLPADTSLLDGLGVSFSDPARRICPICPR